jgi:uncharacterized protein YggE
MKTRWAQLAAFLIVVIATLAASAQQTPGISAAPNTVFVGAEGRFEAAPDTAELQFNLAPQEATAKEAYDHASRAAEQIRQLLRGNGIEPKSAEIGYFSISPVYDWRQPKRKLLGYRVTSAVTLKLKDFAKVAPLVQQIADIDVTDNQSLSYILQDMEAAKIKAVENAYQHAHSEAEALAKAGGRTLGELSYGSVDVAEQSRPIAPMSRLMAMNGAAASEPPPNAEFTPQHVVVTAHVNALFALK